LSAGRGIAFFVASQACLVVEGSVVHHLGTTLAMDQLTLARGVGLAVLIAVLARGEGLAVFRTTQLPLQFLRNGLSVVSLWLIFYSFAHLPLADASTLAYLRPVFVTLLAVLLLREVVGGRRWTATLLGLAGALGVLGPGFGAWHPAYGAAVAGAALNAAALVFSRRLAATDRPVTVMAWLALLSILCSAGALWRPWPWEVWPALMAVAASGALGLFFGQVAVKFADVSLLAPYDYVRLPMLMLVGLVVFLQGPSPTTLLGSALILLSAGVLLLRERKAARG
jgi:drug/metabolite transporter (DMT)-like permease